MTPQFRIAPCGGGWWWIVSDDPLMSPSSPRPSKRDAEQRCREVNEAWRKHAQAQAMKPSRMTSAAKNDERLF